MSILMQKRLPEQELAVHEISRDKLKGSGTFGPQLQFRPQYTLDRRYNLNFVTF